MSRIVRHEFVGSWLLFWLLCISVIGLPLAVLYLMNGTARVETELEDPEQVMTSVRLGRLRSQTGRQQA